MDFFDLKKLLRVNPISAILWSVFSKWYIIVVCASLVVLFWIYKGLDQAGIIKKAEQGLILVLTDTKNMAKYCVPLITNPQKLWNCAQNVSSYRNNTDDETDPVIRQMNNLEKTLKDNLDHPIMNRERTPYDE